MMDLHGRIPKGAVDDADRFDFLVGVSKLVKRMDELHPSEDNDSHYIFLIWVKPDDTEKVAAQIKKNLSKITGYYEWNWKVMPDTGDGLIILSTWL